MAVISLCVYLVSAHVAMEQVAWQIAEPMARTFTRHPVLLSAYKITLAICLNTDFIFISLNVL